MKSETLIHQHPPTPPTLNADMHSGLHHIAQYNVGRHYSFDEPHSHSSAYGSPALGGHEDNPHTSTQTYRSSHGHAGPEFGQGIHYDEYGDGSAYYQDAQFNVLGENQAMFSGSPPTPRSTNEDEDVGRRTRSGRPIAPSSSPHVTDNPKPKPATKPKKAKTGKSEKPKTPKLTAPLSILTKDMDAIPVRNMEEWVNRSAEVRRKEVEKRNGYITRPMNSFMLYRSAYAERTKQWCLQNNHQVVSAVSGESWPLEPQEVRERYNDYAKIERANHQNAHPTYKFSPSKGSTPASKKRKGEFSDDDEPSDLDDAEWAPSHGRPRARSLRRPEKYAAYPVHSINNEYFDRPFDANGLMMSKNSWEMTNEGRPLPMPMQNDLYNQYFQTTMHPSVNMAPAIMEDMRMRRMDTSVTAMHYSPRVALSAVPGGNAADLVQQMQQLDSYAGTPFTDEGQVDPMLLAYEDNGHPHHHEINPVMIHQPDLRNGHIGIMDRELDQDSVHSFIGTGPSHDDFRPEQWHPDPTMAAMEQGSEFEKWIEDHPVG